VNYQVGQFPILNRTGKGNFNIIHSPFSIVKPQFLAFRKTKMFFLWNDSQLSS